MNKRRITLSINSKPNDYPENCVWIQILDKMDTAKYIRAAFRMMPAEVIIESDLIGWFTVQGDKYYVS